MSNETNFATKQDVKVALNKIDEIEKKFYDTESTPNAQNINVDNVPTQNSTNAVTSGGVFSALATKQNKLTAGTNITIDENNNISSSVDTSTLQSKLTAGAGISISEENIISSNIDTTSLQNQITTNADNISSLQSSNQTNANNIRNLQLQASANTSNIVSLQSSKQNKLTAGTGISISEQNVISSTGGGIETVTADDVDSESATNGQVLTADGSGGASWATISGNNGLESVTASDMDSENATSGQVLTADGSGGASWTTISGGGGGSADLTTVNNSISSLETSVAYLGNMLNDRNAIYNTSYEAINQNDVAQTYDSVESHYSYTGTAMFRTCNYYFYCHPDTTNLTLKVTMKISGSASGTGKLSLFLNGYTATSIQDFAYTTSDDLVEVFFTPQITASGNFMFFNITPQSSQSITLTYFKAEIYNCTNPVFLNKERPFTVDYYNGYYYIHDCTGPTAKRAIVNVDDITSIDNLTWVDTGIAAQTMVAVGKLENGSTPMYVSTISYAYIDKNGYTNFINNYANTTRIYDTQKSSMLVSGYPQQHAGICHVDFANASQTQFRKMMMKVDGSMSATTQYSVSTTAFIESTKNHRNYNELQTQNIMAVQNTDFTVDFIFYGKSFSLGMGRVVGCYFTDNDYKNVNVYINIFGKIIKHKLNYNNSAVVSLISSNEIGCYDHYIQGFNNDYFVVKNKKLYYYKNNS